jgi:hypothetical protein
MRFGQGPAQFHHLIAQGMHLQRQVIDAPFVAVDQRRKCSSTATCIAGPQLTRARTKPPTAVKALAPSVRSQPGTSKVFKFADICFDFHMPE